MLWGCSRRACGSGKGSQRIGFGRYYGDGRCAIYRLRASSEATRGEKPFRVARWVRGAMSGPFRIDLNACLSILAFHPGSRILRVSLESGEWYVVQALRTGAMDRWHRKAIEWVKIEVPGARAVVAVKLDPRQRIWSARCERCNERIRVAFWERTSLLECFWCASRRFPEIRGRLPPLQRALRALNGQDSAR
jgi:hypothetical protein